MNEQHIFLLLLIPGAVVTIFLPFGRQKKKLLIKKTNVGS